MPDTVPGSDWPLVTVAIPLYRSRRFLEIIVENIQRIDYPNLEILIGDRHLADDHLDDTVEQLQAHFPADPRLRYVTARDRLSWVAHYNALLAAATGTYFLWMPHDDSYPPNYLRALVARLEAAPDAVLAFGRMDSISLDGRRTVAWQAPPISPHEPWTVRSALRLLFCWNLGLAMRGLFRRAAVVDANLWIRPTRGLVQADMCWLFGLALLGRFEYVPKTHCLKRFYAASAHAQWPRPHYFERTRSVASYLRTTLPAHASGLSRSCGLATASPSPLSSSTRPRAGPSSPTIGCAGCSCASWRTVRQVEPATPTTAGKENKVAQDGILRDLPAKIGAHLWVSEQ